MMGWRAILAALIGALAGSVITAGVFLYTGTKVLQERTARELLSEWWLSCRYRRAGCFRARVAKLQSCRTIQAFQKRKVAPASGFCRWSSGRFWMKRSGML